MLLNRQEQIVVLIPVIFFHIKRCLKKWLNQTIANPQLSLNRNVECWWRDHASMQILTSPGGNQPWERGPELWVPLRCYKGTWTNLLCGSRGNHVAITEHPTSRQVPFVSQWDFYNVTFLHGWTLSACLTAPIQSYWGLLLGSPQF